VLKNIQERDHIDSTREVSPLRQAEDAYVLDNDRMTKEEQMDWLLDLYHEIESR
jgi:cytidylate kinase